MTDREKMVCGLMGCPVGHSLSPLMHGFYSEQTGVDMTYVPFLVRPEALSTAVRGAYALNIRGLNVTVPHKQAVMESLAELDEAAEAIGAVNTLVWTEHGYKGYNTDAEGFRRAVKEAGMTIRDKTCILIGAGGAAKAAAYVLAKEGASRVYVLNRSRDKAEALAAHMNGLFGRTVLFPMALDGWRQIREQDCLAVQTTSVGMHPHADDVPIADEAFYRKLDAAFDVIYTPFTTRFMELAGLAGARAENGLSMLIYQGAAAYELWNPQVKITREMTCQVRELLCAHLGGETI